MSGVRVLTVHKSKGLEYEHVIVMDRIKRAPASRDAVIYDYEGIKLKDIYLRTKGRDALDKDYANALLKEKSLEYEDSLNALYVAFTRARDNLFIILKSKDSAFEILDLICGSSGVLKCEDKNNTATKKEYETLDYKPLYYGTQSDILKLEEQGEEDLKSINFGIAMHYMLEMLWEFNTDSIEYAKDMMINKYGYILEDIEIDDISRRIEMLVNNHEFLKLVDGECYREKAIRHKNNLRYIDLLVKTKAKNPATLLDYSNDTWKVIDYKSSMNYSSHHIKQVRYYIKAVKEITKEEVKGYICYLLDNEIKLVEI